MEDLKNKGGKMGNFYTRCIIENHINRKKLRSHTAIIGKIGIDSIIKGFKEGAENIFRNIPCLMR